jgi:guanylate kinase
LQEIENYRIEEDSRIEHLKQQLKEKQTNEKQALLKRLEREKKELVAQRQVDFAKFVVFLYMRSKMACLGLNKGIII